MARKAEPENIIDWATKCAERIDEEYLPRYGKTSPAIARIAAIIATYAGPLMKMLQEAKRTHSRGYNDEGCDYPPCPCSNEDTDENDKCNCGTEEWNARIDKILGGF